MTYSLRRTQDGAGDSGSMSQALIFTIDPSTGKEHVEVKEDARPAVGVAMRVGSRVTRTYEQDWWQTTVITEIIESRKTEYGEYVRFKTNNSIYEWASF